LGSRYSLFGATLERGFGEQLYRAVSGSGFGKQEQLCAAASNRSFEKQQLREIILGTNFRKQLCTDLLIHWFVGPLNC